MTVLTPPLLLGESPRFEFVYGTRVRSGSLVQVTRIAFPAELNSGKYDMLVEQARRLGRVRALVWRQYGSVAGVGVRDRAIRDQWMSSGDAQRFGVLANAWKETARDAIADIAASRESAKVRVRRAIWARTRDESQRKRLYTALRFDQWTSDRWLSRQMRKHWNRGRMQILQERTDRRRSRLPDQGSRTVPPCRCGERNIHMLSNERINGSRQE